MSIEVVVSSEHEYGRQLSGVDFQPVSLVSNSRHISIPAIHKPSLVKYLANTTSTLKLLMSLHTGFPILSQDYVSASARIGHYDGRGVVLGSTRDNQFSDLAPVSAEQHGAHVVKLKGAGVGRSLMNPGMKDRPVGLTSFADLSSYGYIDVWQTNRDLEITDLLSQRRGVITEISSGRQAAAVYRAREVLAICTVESYPYLALDNTIHWASKGAVHREMRANAKSLLLANTAFTLQDLQYYASQENPLLWNKVLAQLQTDLASDPQFQDMPRDEHWLKNWALKVADVLYANSVLEEGNLYGTHPELAHYEPIITTDRHGQNYQANGASHDFGIVKDIRRVNAQSLTMDRGKGPFNAAAKIPLRSFKSGLGHLVKVLFTLKAYPTLDCLVEGLMLHPDTEVRNFVFINNMKYTSAQGFGVFCYVNELTGIEKQELLGIIASHSQAELSPTTVDILTAVKSTGMSFMLRGRTI